MSQRQANTKVERADKAAAVFTRRQLPRRGKFGVGIVLALWSLATQGSAQPAAGPNETAAPTKSAAPTKPGGPAGAPGGSARSAPPVAGSPSAASRGPSTTPAVPGRALSRPRRRVSAPPDPSAEQLEALRELQKEAEAYTKDAKAYRATLTRIVRHHYEEKRRRILTALNREIAVETKGLKVARLDAIKRLEEFVAKYQKPNDHPEKTPDAMFRLAALYEERERELSDEVMLDPGAAPPDPNLRDAIALYKRIINEYPAYRELAGVYYYLGHAYSDMARLEESQQVFRSLVCHNHYRYPVPPDPKDPEKDSIGRLPQDHDADWWLGWMQRHPEPVTSGLPEDEEVFRDPYPADCMAVAQKTRQGEVPRYLPEVWWRLGDFHFDEIDPYGGPYNLNRAESAYRHAMSFKQPPVYGVAMYKLAWTFYKQQRYQVAVRQFVELLRYTDEQERLTGNPGADFRAEAYAYIAGSLTYLDFAGPGPNEPYVGRNDIFDLESDSAVIEAKMHAAIDRLQDPALIPQNKAGCLPKKSGTCPTCCDPKWTINIYRALAFEFREYNHYHNLIDLNELILAKWPLHRDAPDIQNQIAQVYETLASQSQGAEHRKYSQKALEARGKLIRYVATLDDPNPAWVDFNKEDPEAIRRAELLVRGGLQRAAADHTNAARRLVERARSADDPAERQQAFEGALAEYRLAAQAWGGYLLQDENAEDAYESRFWLADAYTNVVVIQVQLNQRPSQKDIGLAQKMARDVRDSNEDHKYLQPAALMVVRVAQQLVVLDYRLWDESGGKQGLEKRSKLKEKGEGDGRTFAVEPVPKALGEMVQAFDEYVSTVPLEYEPNRSKPNHDRFAYLAGEVPFLYGQFPAAKKRMGPIYQAQCGQTEYGYLAWEKLVTMANWEGDFETSQMLSKASKQKSCAFSEDQRLTESRISSDTIKTGFYKEAAAAYKKAEAMKDGPERKKQWRRAAELYGGALREAPERREAPEAAILGANAYKQIGEYDKAIAMYELFIKEYGREDTLAKLERGDPSKKTPPQPAELKDRVKYLKVAYDALAEAYVLFFDYRRAAQTYDKIASISRFDDKAQREAAYNAVSLYGKTGEREKVNAAKKRFFAMNPSAEERAEIEWLIASGIFKEWDPQGPNRGSNRTARERATSAMDGFHRRFSNDRSAHKYVVMAAYQASRLRRSAGDRAAKRWCGNTLSAFAKFKGASANNEKGQNLALGTLQASMAAECEYRSIDEELKKRFDYDAGHHRYKGVMIDVKKEFEDDVNIKAKGYYDRLQAVIDKYASRPWAVAAKARQGSLYDSCRTGLYNAREPGLKLYNDKEQKVLKQLDDLCANQGNDSACEKYDTFTANRRMAWRKARDTNLATTDHIMVRNYTEAVTWAKAWQVRVDAVDRAIARLAFYTEIIGDPKLRQYAGGVKVPGSGAEFVYRDGMFMRMRRGMATKVKPQILPAPLPALVSP